MIRFLDQVTVFKLAIKTLFFSALTLGFIYTLLNLQPPSEKTAIDKRIIYSPDKVDSQIAEYTTTPQGGVSWNLFSKTKRIKYKYTDTEGNKQEGIRPEFSDTLAKLNEQDIVLQGYMFPLESSEDQAIFLFGPFPMSCPYQYHVGPELVMEVQAAHKILFQSEPITLKGKLELVPHDDVYNIFYRLKEAQLIQ